MVLEVLNAIVDKYRRKPSPKRPSRIEVAKTVGIRNPYSIDESVIPTERYLETDGAVPCERTNQSPNPPETVIARYSLPTGETEVIAHTEYAKILKEQYSLDDQEAEVLALSQAGWDVQDLTDIGISEDPSDFLNSAKMKVDSNNHQ
jgi:hypothetical protein